MAKNTEKRHGGALPASAAQHWEIEREWVIYWYSFSNPSPELDREVKAAVGEDLALWAKVWHLPKVVLKSTREQREREMITATGPGISLSLSLSLSLP